MGSNYLKQTFNNIRQCSEVYNLLYVIERIENGYELSTVEVTFSKRIKDKFTDAKELHFMYKGIEIKFKVDTSWNSFCYANSPIFLTIFADKDIALKEMQKHLNRLKREQNINISIWCSELI